MNMDVQVEHLEATVRELQDIHEDLKKKAIVRIVFPTTNDQHLRASTEW